MTNHWRKEQLIEEISRIQLAISQREELFSSVPDKVLETTINALKIQYDNLIVELQTSFPETKNVESDWRQIAGEIVPSGLNVINPTQLWNEILAQSIEKTDTEIASQSQLISEELQVATEKYLTYLFDRHRFLEFKGMGISDQVPLRVPLTDLYVPLKAYPQIPKGETWSRDNIATGIDNGAILIDSPSPILELIQKNDGVIILGDPGAGKTTFLKYLTLISIMGRIELLGMRVRIPILIPLSAYSDALKSQDISLHKFFAQYYQALGLEIDLDLIIEHALLNGGILFLLDGLDEVHNLTQRHLVTSRVNEFFLFHSRAGNKFVITSRIVGYRDARISADKLIECTLIDFDDDDIDHFTLRWVSAIEKAARGRNPTTSYEINQELKGIRESIYRSSGVRRLASNPLLLTILSLMKRQGVELPERRVELYQKTVDVLCKHWNLARGLGRPPTRDLDVIEIIKILAPLALWMHETNPLVGLVDGGDMHRKLSEIYAIRQIDNPEVHANKILIDVRDYAGILLERGMNRYGFIHLTFQEYLAAIAIAQFGQQEVTPIIDYLRNLISIPHWREVILLTIGYLGIIQNREQAASSVIMAIIRGDEGKPGEVITLVGEAILDVWPGGVTIECTNYVIQGLLETSLNDLDVEPHIRVRAGQVLGKLGDPRKEVLSIEHMNYCYVPPGSFYMGSEEDEHLNEYLDYGFWIAKFPVTNAQYRRFIEAGGYQTDRYWLPNGRKWRNESNTTNFPEIVSDFAVPNSPVVAITWHECMAYCAWLTEFLHTSSFLKKSWKVSLPSEAEWEKAARGGVMIPNQPIIISLKSFPETVNNENLHMIKNDNPKRLYPWGDSLDVNMWGFNNRQVKTTGAVGCFPKGKSPYGVEDLSGNIWEWTRNIWGTNWWKPTFTYPYNPSDNRENITVGDEYLRMVRGGSFFDDVVHAQCVYRSRNGGDVRHINHGFRVCVIPTNVFAHY